MPLTIARNKCIVYAPCCGEQAAFLHGRLPTAQPRNLHTATPPIPAAQLVKSTHTNVAHSLLCATCAVGAPLSASTPSMVFFLHPHASSMCTSATCGWPEDVSAGGRECAHSKIVDSNQNRSQSSSMLGAAIVEELTASAAAKSSVAYRWYKPCSATLSTGNRHLANGDAQHHAISQSI